MGFLIIKNGPSLDQKSNLVSLSIYINHTISNLIILNTYDDFPKELQKLTMTKGLTKTLNLSNLLSDPDQIGPT